MTERQKFWQEGRKVGTRGRRLHGREERYIGETEEGVELKGEKKGKRKES
jgi:hypothetical protein